MPRPTYSIAKQFGARLMTLRLLWAFGIFGFLFFWAPIVKLLFGPDFSPASAIITLVILVLLVVFGLNHAYRRLMRCPSCDHRLSNMRHPPASCPFCAATLLDPRPNVTRKS